MRQRASESRVRALITGTGRYVPDDVWTSDMVDARVDESSDGWHMPKGIIRLATGVGERRYAPTGFCSSDLAAQDKQLYEKRFSALLKDGFKPESYAEDYAKVKQAIMGAS